MFENASPVELIWSAGSLLALLFHAWLSIEAYLDWMAALRARVIAQTEFWREKSAGYYLIGQLFLFLPLLIHTAIGVAAMTIPPSPAEQEQGTASILQVGLLVAEWMALVAGLGFWMARRALPAWTSEHDAKYPPGDVVKEE